MTELTHSTRLQMPVIPEEDLSSIAHRDIILGQRTSFWQCHKSEPNLGSESLGRNSRLSIQRLARRHRWYSVSLHSHRWIRTHEV